MAQLTAGEEVQTNNRNDLNPEHSVSGPGNFTLVTVGGSVSTGSTPLIDMLREYSELHVIDGEFRPGKHVFRIAASIHNGIKTDPETFNEHKRNTINYGDQAARWTALYFRVLIRLPGPAAKIIRKHISDLSRLMMAKRGYEIRVPGYKKATGFLFDCLADLDNRMDNLTREQRTVELSNCLGQFFHSVSVSFVRDNPGTVPVFDQMINPNKLFSDNGGLILARLLPSAAIIVVSRDVRDQYCDMIRKRKKGYHLMDPTERVDRYIHEYSRRYDNMHRQLKDLPQNVLHVRFEDLIFHYQDTKKIIEDFLGVYGHHSPQKYFDPLVAAQNTRLYRKHGNREEIVKIEQYMGQWLYPFEDVPEKPASKEAHWDGNP